MEQHWAASTDWVTCRGMLHHSCACDGCDAAAMAGLCDHDCGGLLQQEDGVVSPVTGHAGLPLFHGSTAVSSLHAEAVLH